MGSFVLSDHVPLPLNSASDCTVRKTFMTYLSYRLDPRCVYSTIDYLATKFFALIFSRFAFLNDRFLFRSSSSEMLDASPAASSALPAGFATIPSLTCALCPSPAADAALSALRSRSLSCARCAARTRRRFLFCAARASPLDMPAVDSSVIPPADVDVPSSRMFQSHEGYSLSGKATGSARSLYTASPERTVPGAHDDTGPEYKMRRYMKISQCTYQSCLFPLRQPWTSMRAYRWLRLHERQKRWLPFG